MSEYWIQEDGSVNFADGDIGDMNHEGIVISKCQRDVVELCEHRFDIAKKSTWGGHERSFNDDDYVNWDEFLTALGTAAGEELAAQNPKWQDYVDNDPHYFIPWALKQSGVKKSLFDCANGLGDARDYAMQYWNWKTYRDGSIDTWRITRNDLSVIIDGIENIASESGWSNRRLSKMSFNITVFSNRRHFALTYEQMKRWLERPQTTPPVQNQQYDYLTPQADKQIRDIEYQKLHPAYRRPGVHPFGDSVMSFRTFFFLENESLAHKLADVAFQAYPNNHDAVMVLADVLEEMGHPAAKPLRLGTPYPEDDPPVSLVQSWPSAKIDFPEYQLTYYLQDYKRVFGVRPEILKAHTWSKYGAGAAQHNYDPPLDYKLSCLSVIVTNKPST